MSNEKKYNGWNSYETWLFALHFMDYLQQVAQDEELSLESAEEYAKEVYDEATPNECGVFMGDVIGAFGREVDWREIAEHMIEF